MASTRLISDSDLVIARTLIVTREPSQEAASQMRICLGQLELGSCPDLGVDASATIQTSVGNQRDRPVDLHRRKSEAVRFAVV